MVDDGVEEQAGIIKGKMGENGECLIDVKEGETEDGAGKGKSRKVRDSKVCRICHDLGKELELISLGCDCKGELGSSHQHCAEAWFTQKGDRVCEICGKMAKNVKAGAEERWVSMMEWDETRMAAAAASVHDDSHESSRRCKRLFCNMTLAALLLLFLLLWLFRIINLT